MRHLPAILALLLLATGQPFAVAAGVLCGLQGKDCPASAVLGVRCCCDTGCECDGSKDRTNAPAQNAGHDGPRVEFAFFEMPTLTPGVSDAELFKPRRLAVELVIAHALPRVAVTCIRLN